MTLTKFNNLPVEKQRVLIAKDVIKWLDSGFLKPKRGRYLTFSREMEDALNHPDEVKLWDSSAQKVMETCGECFVCARGALTAAWALNFGKGLKVSDIHDNGFFWEVKSVFTEDMQDAMEWVFEKKMWPLRRIFNNIIKNNGEFLAVTPWSAQP